MGLKNGEKTELDFHFCRVPRSKLITTGEGRSFLPAQRQEHPPRS